ncbi:hypothetical protein QTP88_004520 [Uroleucon formosanum]
MTFCRAKSIGYVSEICQQFSGLINNTIAQLNKRFNAYNTLKTHRIAKRGLINIVASFEKWTFGILNENDLIEIDEKIKARTGRNKMTLDLINIQTRIVKSTLNSFNNITNTINENTIKLKTTLEQLICEVNNSIHNIQKIDVSQTLTQHLIFFNILLTEFNQETEELIESIVWGQNRQLHPSIINPNTIINQLKEIEKILPKQLSIPQSPEKINNFLDFLKLLTISLNFMDTYLIYTIYIPLSGSDSKQRKLHFTVISSFEKNQHENVSEISQLPRAIEKFSNNSNEIQSELIPEFSTKVSNIIYPSSSLPIEVLSDQDESNVTINKYDVFSSSESDSNQNKNGSLIIKLIKKVYCSLCMAFTRPNTTPFSEGVEINLKYLYRQLEKHENSIPHDNACKAYFNISSGQTITNSLSSHRQKMVELNRKIMTRIVDIVLLIAKQGLAFRGKRNEAAYSMSDLTSNLNQGNFLEIVKLVAKYDPVLQTHINNSMKKSLIKKGKASHGSCVTFLSKTTLNKILNITGNLIKNKIAKEVIQSEQYSLEVDSTQDTSVMDQLCICIRYVLNEKINERMLALVESKSGTGKALYNIVEEELESLNIPLTNLIGESFDGAASMSGCYNGLQAHLKKIAPESIFTHCHAHVLNLIVSDVTSCCSSAPDLFNLLQKSAVFFLILIKELVFGKNFFLKIKLEMIN